MRIQCPRCQALAEVTRFSAASDPPRIEFRCTACGEQVTESGLVGPGPAPATEPAPASAPSPRTSSAHGAEGSDALWNGWDRVAEGFDDASRHDAFLAACEVADALPFAAARYREWAESHPEDTVAPACLKRVVALAQVKVHLLSSRPSREKDPLRQAVILGLIFLLVLAVVVMTAPMVFRGLANRGSEGGGGGSGAAPSRPGVMEPPLQNLRAPAPAPPRRPVQGGSQQPPPGVTPAGSTAPFTGPGSRPEGSRPVSPRR